MEPDRADATVTRPPNGGVADTLDEAKAAFRAAPLIGFGAAKSRARGARQNGLWGQAQARIARRALGKVAGWRRAGGDRPGGLSTRDKGPRS